METDARSCEVAKVEVPLVYNALMDTAADEIASVRIELADSAYPRNVRGECNGPPEDCGGIPGFYDKLEAAADPRHPDHREIKKWLRDYDAETIDEASIKLALGRIANQRPGGSVVRHGFETPGCACSGGQG